jgi:hypothetical protein
MTTCWISRFHEENMKRILKKVWKSARFPVVIRKYEGNPKGNLKAGWITRLYKENAKGILKILRLSNPPGGTRPVT